MNWGTKILVLFGFMLISAIITRATDVSVLQTSLTTLRSKLTALRDQLNNMPAIPTIPDFAVEAVNGLHPAPRENKLPKNISRPYNPKHGKGQGKIQVTYQDGSLTIYEHNVPKGAHEGDCIISPQGSIAWNWHLPKKAEKTSHGTGIPEADVKALLPDADIFILSRGVDLVLQENAVTTKYLKDQGKTVFVLQTDDAIKKYNELVQEYIRTADKTGKRVAALLHSTC